VIICDFGGRKNRKENIKKGEKLSPEKAMTK
jgi:hypothetical protein